MEYVQAVPERPMVPLLPLVMVESYCTALMLMGSPLWPQLTNGSTHHNTYTMRIGGRATHSHGNHICQIRIAVQVATNPRQNTSTM